MIDSEFYYYKVTSGNLPLIGHNYQKIKHDWVDLSCSSGDGGLSTNAHTFLFVDIRSYSMNPRRVTLARIFKEAGLRSPHTQLTKVQIEFSVQGRHTEARLWLSTPRLENDFLILHVHVAQAFRRSCTLHHMHIFG